MPSKPLNKISNNHTNTPDLQNTSSARLALGTVQFGMPYGVANTNGQVNRDVCSSMLIAARSAGIDTLDTAVVYGNAEILLGGIGVQDFHVVSKLPAVPEHINAVDDWVLNQVEASLQRLRIPSLAGLMLHAPDDLTGPHGLSIARGLQRARDAGLAERIGLSVYSPKQLAALIDRVPVEIIQIPSNIFDRRFAETGWLERLVSNGVQVHARSAFLQGLLLMPPDRIPSKFARYSAQLNRWQTWLTNQVAGVSPLQACLAHVSSYPEISRVVVGADSLAQLLDIIDAASTLPMRGPESLASPEIPLIDPSQWNTL